jgi:hypothetical protein
VDDNALGYATESTWNTWNTCTADVDIKQTIRSVRELMARLPKPQFVSVVMRRETLERIRETLARAVPEPQVVFGEIDRLCGFPLYVEEPLSKRIAMVLRGDIPGPALVEHETGEFAVIDKLESPFEFPEGDNERKSNG